MNTFRIDDMTCGHCAARSRGALTALDPHAQVRIDLNARRVEVESAHATAVQVRDAIEQAGYTPAPAASPAAAAAATRAGCCCG